MKLCIWGRERELEPICDTIRQSKDIFRLLLLSVVVVCVYVCGVCLCMKTYVCRGQRSRSGVFLNCSQSYSEVTSNYIYVHMCVCGHICAMVCVLRSEDNLQESTLTLQYVLPGE